MQTEDIESKAERLTFSTSKTLIDMGYVLTLAESFALKDRITDLLEEEEDEKNDSACMIAGDEALYGDI